MGCNTIGRIKGFVKHEDLLNYIKEKWDPNAESDITKKVMRPFAECNYTCKLNESCESDTDWYIISGFIYFRYKGESRQLFYNYSNVNFYENIRYYSPLGLIKMVEAETTTVSLGFHGKGVEIIKELVSHFDGGWIDENDCDDDEFYEVVKEGVRVYVDIAIKKKWFDMIISGEKKEEYREIKRYYRSRFANILGIRPDVLDTVLGDKESRQFEVKFNNGYSENCPSFVANCTLSIATGKEEWGAEKDKFYYVLHIKNIIEENTGESVNG